MILARLVDSQLSKLQKLLRCGVTGLGFSFVIQFIAGPEEAIRQQVQVIWRFGGFEVVAEGGGKDAALAVGVNPADGVFAAIARTFGAQERMRAFDEFDGLIQFVAGGFPIGGKAQGDGVLGIQFFGGKGLEGIMDFGTHAAIIFPFMDLAGLAEGVHGAMDHDGGFAGLGNF